MATLASTRPATDEYASFYETYIGLLPGDDILQALAEETDAALDFLRGIPDERAGSRYAPGKWSIREVIGHVGDAERIMLYRALRIARGDQTPLPGFDENAYVEGANFGDRTLADLVAEFEAVRRASLAFFRSLPPEAWTRRGLANDHPISVRALAYIIAGHELHHRRLLRERYLGAGTQVG